MMHDLEICQECKDEYKSETCELGCEAFYIDCLEGWKNDLV